MPGDVENQQLDTSAASAILESIRLDSRDELEKGESFEKLVKLLISEMPEFEVKEAHRWKKWPDREKLTNLPLADSGIDMVARLHDNSLVAIQCKCYDEKYQVNRSDIDKFLAVSGQPFDSRWVITTCKWGKKAEEIIHTIEPPVRRIDFHKYDEIRIFEGKVELEKREPNPLQVEAIENTISRLSNADRGQLIMACGTGKTYTALRITEQLVPDGGRILFLAPSIALVSQARREWLRYKTRPLRGLVVCSDRTSGGRGESEDIRVSELECTVTTDPGKIASTLNSMDGTGVVFCTYQSLEKVSKAQLDHNAPAFDMIIADEAHRTTGVEKQTGFHMVHQSHSIRSKRRLYMTATPRIYTVRSKGALKSKGYDVYDMEDWDMFGEVMHRLTFKDAVNAGMLSDYRVLIMVMRERDIARDLYDRFLLLITDGDGDRIITYEDVERLLGTAFAINGITEKHGNADRLPRVLGFANSRKRSRAFRDLLNLTELHEILKNRMDYAPQDSITMHEVEHLDGNSSALKRGEALRSLGRADAGSPRMICNVQLFTEGVDVPSLNAVAFLDPRKSTVDVVQAVGRVMRKAPGKQFGYIIIPVPIKGESLTEELESNPDGWKTTGNVLRALQSHDGRLPENPVQFIQIHDPFGTDDAPGDTIDGIQSTLEFQEISEKFYAKVVAASGLAKPGQMVSDEIESAVDAASHAFVKSNLADHLADILGLKIDSEEYTDKDICKISALLVINACLLHRRLQDKSSMTALASLGDINGSDDPRGILMDSWKLILEKDYAPVFEPALKVVETLPDLPIVKKAIHRMVDRANSVADSLGELGYDHSGPLYHKILGTAKSDSANYTDNVSAIMLARLAFSENFIDWHDKDRLKQLRVIDPACGTGTLLMAALKTIKDRMKPDKLANESNGAVHRWLVEDVLCGLDINRHAVQLAACNLTLGAPTVEYKNMNLYTMKHGPQPGSGAVKAGSAEILLGTSSRDTMKAFVQPMRNVGDLQAKHVDNAKQREFLLEGLDVVIMNPPFGSNVSRSRKFPPNVVKQMQKNELVIREKLKQRDKAAGDAIDLNSISTFFTPLADRLLNPRIGTLAKVMPVTACINASGLTERKFLADRFHIECVITSHDPKHVNFSYKTDIHECLMICRRHDGGDKPSTEFVSLSKMPKNAKEAIDAADAIANGKDVTNSNGEILSKACRWTAERVGAGDWTPVQWYDDKMAETIYDLESSPLLEPIGTRYAIGPAGRRTHDAYKICGQDEPGAVKIFHSISSKLRKTIHGEPESWHSPKSDKKRMAEGYWKQRSKLLVAQRFDTISGRLTAVYSDTPSIGKGWVPVGIKDEYVTKALAVWWNSTPARMMLLNRRAKKLTYPQWSLKHLEEIRIPKPDNLGWSALHDAYEKIYSKDLLPMGKAIEDPALTYPRGR